MKTAKSPVIIAYSQEIKSVILIEGRTNCMVCKIHSNLTNVKYLDVKKHDVDFCHLYLL